MTNTPLLLHVTLGVLEYVAVQLTDPVRSMVAVLVSVVAKGWHMMIKRISLGRRPFFHFLQQIKQNASYDTRQNKSAITRG